MNGKKLPLSEMPAPFSFGKGASTRIIREKKTILLDHAVDEQVEEMGTVVWGKVLPTKAWLGVPILAGDEAIGTIVLENTQDANAYSESEVSLLNTLAASMGVALENARLFKEEQERSAELAIINRIQEGLASTLDFQAIIDLVGDKIRDILAAQGIHIALYDDNTDQIQFPYIYELGNRSSKDWSPLSTGFSSYIIKNRKPLLLLAAQAEEAVAYEPPPDGTR